MRKLYRTKNAMFFERTLMTRELNFLVTKHFIKYGQKPKRIYVSEEDWDRYESELPPEDRADYMKFGYPKFNLSSKRPTLKRIGALCLSFRGIPVVRIDDWRMLVRKND